MADALDNRGMFEFYAGALDKAMEDIRRCLTLRPHDPRATYYVGTILLLQGKFDEARAAYEFALPFRNPLGNSGTEYDLIDLRELGHAPPEATVFLGWLYLKAGKRDLATAEFKKYLTDHADGPLAGWAKELLAAHSPK
jgi:tetratricopeptide (TPR) repeat protein